MRRRHHNTTSQRQHRQHHLPLLTINKKLLSSVYKAYLGLVGLAVGEEVIVDDGENVPADRLQLLLDLTLVLADKLELVRLPTQNTNKMNTANQREKILADKLKLPTKHNKMNTANQRDKILADKLELPTKNNETTRPISTIKYPPKSLNLSA